MKKTMRIAFILLTMITASYLSGCAKNSPLATSICNSICPDMSANGDIDMISYLLFLQELDQKQLIEELDVIKKSYLDSPGEGIMLQYATLLSLGGTPFEDIETASTLLESYLNDPAVEKTKLNQYARHLHTIIEDRQKLTLEKQKVKKALANEKLKLQQMRNNYITVKDKLDALRSIERSIKLRQDTLERSPK